MNISGKPKRQGSDIKASRQHNRIPLESHMSILNITPLFIRLTAAHVGWRPLERQTKILHKITCVAVQELISNDHSWDAKQLEQFSRPMRLSAQAKVAQWQRAERCWSSPRQGCGPELQHPIIHRSGQSPIPQSHGWVGTLSGFFRYMRCGPTAEA